MAIGRLQSLVEWLGVQIDARLLGFQLQIRLGVEDLRYLVE
jgi:hypothetical protein